MAKKRNIQTLPDAAPAPAEVRHERWPRADVRAILKAMRLFESRHVIAHMGCKLCKEYLRSEGVDNGGNSLVVCACARRVWE